MQAEVFSSRFRPRKTKRERRAEKWEGIAMRQGWGLIGEASVSVKSRGKGVGVQCDLRGGVTENPSRRKRKSAILVQGGMTILGDKITVISCAALDNWQDRGRTPRSCRTTASTSHLGHHTPRTTELDTSPPEHLHFSPPHKSTQRAERDLLDWDL
ncbi:UNVERIFIED_CONTAM: hypothetical protein FKN15_059843 [Acipenser sinensis]